jgi:predicted Zn-dependent protease
MEAMHRVWLWAALLAVAANCALTQKAGEAETGVAKVLVPDDQEKQLGEQLHQQLDQQGVKRVTDPVVTGYVEKLLGEITPHARRDRESDYHVHVIDDPMTVNAFATPGGHLYVYSGLLLTADNESEVVGVMAHEVGHVVARHAARALVAQYGLSGIAALALGQNPTLLEQVAAGVLGDGMLLAHSRSEENEADTYAVRYAAAAGYDPRGIAMFFRKLPSKSDAQAERAMAYLQTHPATPERIEHVNQVIAREHLAGAKVGAQELVQIKQHLQGRAPVSSR